MTPRKGSEIALILALTIPGRHFPWAGWIYFSMVILVPLHRVIVRRCEQK